MTTLTKESRIVKVTTYCSSDNNSSDNDNQKKKYIELLIERRDHVFIIQFNRPSKGNALKRRTYLELIQAIYEARYDPTITIIVITGNGNTFTTGNDLHESHRLAHLGEYSKHANSTLCYIARSLISCPKVLVALVNGPCIGIGVTLSALCDIVYCTDTAYFQVPFTQLGICPEACSTYLLPATLGRSKAAELLLFNERLSAQQALQFNFVARIYHHHELDTEFWPKIQQYSQLPTESLKATKRLLRRRETDTLLQALKDECAELVKLRYGRDHLNALERFVERRAGKNLSKL